MRLSPIMIDMENKAYAKINLTLDVLAKRGDGFHELATIMRAVDVFDELSIAFGGEDASVIAEPPLPMENAALRAARAYMEAGGTAGARITIKRGIPEEAGLGGSSADAAAVLRAMQAHYGALGEEELFAIALSIGSDVPFCLAGGSALCLGRGERMTKLPDISLPLLIAKPKAGVSTAKLFSLLSPPYMPPRSMEAAEAVRAGDAAALCG